MKIVFLTTDITQVGGVERVLCKLSNKFIEKYNYEIEIISVYKNQNKQVYFDLNANVKITYLNVESNDSSMNKIRRVNNQLKLIKKIKESIKCKNFDIIITSNTMLGVAIALNKKYVNGKIIAAEHGDYYYFGRIWRFARKHLYNKLDKVVVLTSKDKHIYSLFLDNVVIIPNPLTFETKQKSELNQKLILSAGRLEDEKGFEYIIDAFSRVYRDHSNWRLEIVGEGSQRDFLQDKINSLGLEKSIKISNFTSNMEEKYINSSIYTLTSKTEAFPLVILEAMECGVPCISFDLAGPKEIIKDSIDGIIIKQYDIDSLVDRINYLIENDNKRIKMGCKSKENIQRYSIDNIGEIWMNLFNEILN